MLLRRMIYWSAHPTRLFNSTVARALIKTPKKQPGAVTVRIPRAFPVLVRQVEPSRTVVEEGILMDRH